jgi:glycosyltransferase involved in cell wall biosynthesis
VVPCYNEESTVLAVVERLLSLDAGLQYEIIVVDDGSIDRTCEVLKGIDRLKVVRNEMNMGKGAAVLHGLEHATGEIVVIQDADLEYGPEDIPRLAWPILRGDCDAVYGSRFRGTISGMRLSHYIGNKVLSWFTRVLYGGQITDVMTGHKAVRRVLLKDLHLKPSRFAFEIEVTLGILGRGLLIHEVPISYQPRKFGKAKISWFDGVECFVRLLVRRVGMNRSLQ